MSASSYIKSVDFIELGKIEDTEFILPGGKDGDLCFEEV